MAGRCFVESAFKLPDAEIDDLIADLESTPDDPDAVDLSHLMYGVAGRSALTDPPYFVFGVSRPQKDAEIEAAMFLLFGLARFDDYKTAADLSRYERRRIAERDVYVGREDMLGQTEHQQGRPYLYQTDEYMFLVITEDDAWAEDAIRQLP